MPIYEYHCGGCGNDFEVMQRITAPPAESCELCGEGPVQKLISQSTFILKGSGWYVTDYGRGNGKGKDNHTATSSENTAPTTSGESETSSPAKESTTKSSTTASDTPSRD